jgi:iron complex transport system ATP-binding protein
VTGLDYAYDRRPILEKIGFTVQPGQVVVVLGVNGAGKSTLLRCLAGILTPQGGAVACDGLDVTRLTRRQAARLFGYVPQGRSPGKMTVFENVLLGRRPHFTLSPSRRDMALAEAVIRRLGLEELSFMTLDALSGGQARKVAVARALAQKPRLLLLDEPTAGLDMKSRLELADIIEQEVAQGEVAAVVATHDLPLALAVAHHLVLLRGHTVLDVVAREDFTARHVEEVFGVKAVLVEVAGRQVVVPVGVAGAGGVEKVEEASGGRGG